MEATEKQEAKYVICIGCGYLVSWLAHSLLRVAVDCPRCVAEKQFGPGVYVEDFRGYTLKEAATLRANKNPRLRTTRSER